MMTDYLKAVFPAILLQTQEPHRADERTGKIFVRHCGEEAFGGMGPSQLINAVSCRFPVKDTDSRVLHMFLLIFSVFEGEFMTAMTGRPSGTSSPTVPST